MTNLNSSIEWTDTSWNPTTGCTKVSDGCDNCYAEKITERFHGKGSFATVQLHPERLDAPLRWRKPRRVFVNSMSDLFHQDVPDEFIGEVFDRMGAAPSHTFQILTKRHGRMRSLLRRWERCAAEGCRCPDDAPKCSMPVDVKYGTWPLPNVWLGVSVEDQKRADLRIPALLDTPAAVRFLSCEPLLGPVSLWAWLSNPSSPRRLAGHPNPQLDWVIVGGESGPAARPMHPEWARSLRDQCQAAGVPFFFKQWGEWAPNGMWGLGDNERERCVGEPDERGGREVIRRVGKKAAGRELDGRTHDEFPEVAS